MLKNPGFSQSPGLQNWNYTTTVPAVTFASDDQLVCSASGSAQLSYQFVPNTTGVWGNISQCVKITGGLFYWFGFQYKPASGQLDTYVDFYQSDNCSGDFTRDISLTVNATSGSDVFLGTYAMGDAPANARSANVYIGLQGAAPVWVDSVYLNASSNSY